MKPSEQSDPFGVKKALWAEEDAKIFKAIREATKNISPKIIEPICKDGDDKIFKIKVSRLTIPPPIKNIGRI